jgi:hypothetical protein
MREPDPISVIVDQLRAWLVSHGPYCGNPANTSELSKCADCKRNEELIARLEEYLRKEGQHARS